MNRTMEANFLPPPVEETEEKPRMRYQGDHGLRVTGNVTLDTLRALGLKKVTGS
jgi:hypothetical protein